MSKKAIISPITKEPVSAKAAKRIRDLRKIRSNARPDARSGHPGRRASGTRARHEAAVLIAQTYLSDATGGPL